MIINRDSIEHFNITERAISNIGRILGAITKSYIEPVADDSHANFLWCNTNLHLETREIHVKNDRHIHVAYHPSKSHIHFETETIHTHKEMVPLKNNSLDYTLKKIKNILQNLDLNVHDFEEAVEFRYPELTQINGKLFTPQKQYLHYFEFIRSTTNNILTTYAIQNNVHAELPRVWPHNFDTGIVCSLDNNIFQYAGYAPADTEVCEVPYFYNSFYSNNKQIISNNILTAGEWRNEDWKGAILRLDSFNSINEFVEAAPLFFNQSSRDFLNN